MADDIGAVFRQEAGRCTATMIRILGDVDLAEDAVAEAFAIAAEQWPNTGLPPNPGGWITTTARNRAIDRLRREAENRPGRQRPVRFGDAAHAAVSQRRTHRRTHPAMAGPGRHKRMIAPSRS